MRLTADSDLIQRESFLPGLRVILDDDALLEYLRSTWPQVQWRSLQGRYLRYKPRTNCLVALEAQIIDAQGLWQSLWLYAKAFHAEDDSKLEKWQQKPGMSPILGIGRWIWLEKSVKISVLPNDTKLKFLIKLLEPQYQAHTMAKLLPKPKRLPKTGQLRLLRYKPERRLVAQWGEGATPQALIKAYTPKQYKGALRHAKGFQSQPDLAIAPLIGHRDKHHLLAWDWLSGVPLPDWMSDPGFDKHDLSRVGMALAQLHQQTPGHLKKLTSKSQTQALLDLADWLGFLLPAWRLESIELAHTLSQRLNQLPTITTAIHGDFYADQVLWRDDRIAIIDLDRAATGHPAQDIGNFMAHLERQALWDDRPLDRVRLFETSFLAGYENVGLRISREALQLYTAFGLFLLTPEAFRYRHSNWPQRIQMLLDRIRQILQSDPIETENLWVEQGC